MKKISSFKIKNKQFHIYIYKNKKYIRKIFTNPKEKKNYLNEIKAYKIFNKQKVFRTVKFYKNGKSLNGYFLDLEFVNGKRPNLFDLKNIYKLKNNNLEKENINKYLKRLSKNYLKKRILNKKNINYLFINFKLKNQFDVITTHTHGDFAMYNCVKLKNVFYVFDLEKYSKRIFIFDLINWFVHPFIYNLAKIISFKNLKLLNNYILKIIYFHIYLLYLILIFLFNLKINFKEYKIYYFLYLTEKSLICKTDLYKIKNKKEKNIIRNFYNIVDFYINKLLREINNVY